MSKEKDAFYFSHDYDPTGDPKMQAMMGDYGAIGYGVYWRIVEMLHSEPSHKLPFKKYIYLAIAKQMSTNVQQNSTMGVQVEINAEQVEMFVKCCLNDYELFHSDDDFFWSNRVLRNMEKRDNISEKRSGAGKKSAEKRKNKTNVQQVSTSAQQKSTNVEQKATKERKGKEIKGNEIIINSRCYAKIPELAAAANDSMKIFKPDWNEKILAAQAFELATKYVNKPIDDLQSLTNEWINRFEKLQKEIYGNRWNPTNRDTHAEVIGEGGETSF